MSKLTGRMHIQDAADFRVVSIDRRWRDLGQASVVVEITAGGLPPRRERLRVADRTRVHLDIELR
jgi:hypothetical protein